MDLLIKIVGVFFFLRMHYTLIMCSLAVNHASKLWRKKEVREIELDEWMRRINPAKVVFKLWIWYPSQLLETLRRR